MSALGQFIFAVAILFSIGLHELGHLGTAKWFGIKVEQYFIGFGPKLWSTRRGETEYGVKLLPLGGFVRIAGMNPYEEIAPEDRERVFQARKPWQRAIVLAAGSFTHFLVALGIFAAVFAIVGTFRPTPTVDRVSPVSSGERTPALDAGFRSGDELASIDGIPVEGWEQAVTIIQERPGQRIPIVVRRDGERITLRPTIAERRPSGKPGGFLGVSPVVEQVKYGPITAIGKGAEQLGSGMVASLKAFGNLFSPSSIGRIVDRVQGERKGDETDPATVVGLTRVAGGFAREGDWAALALTIAGVNVFIGVANLFPLPPLDGGHLAVLGYEKIRRRRVDMRKLIPIAGMVIALLGSLFLVLLYLDIVQPITLPS